MATRMERGWWGLSLVAMLALVACEGAESKPKASAGAAPAQSDVKGEADAKNAEPTPTDADADGHAQDGPPGVRGDGEIISAVTWFEGTLEQALAKAKAENKQVFMDVGAYWCPPCHRLDEEVFVHPEVGKVLGDGYVALHVDAEKGEGPELVERYRVQAFPTMLVLEASGLEKGRVVDFLEPEAFLVALERISAGDNVLAELLDDVERNPDDLKKRYALAHAHVLAADVKAAAPQYEAVMLGDPKDELGLASRVMYDQALFVTYKIEQDPEGAIAQLRTLQRRFPDSKMATNAYRLIGRLLCGLGREDEAVASLEAMIATNPSDARLAASYGWFAFRQKCGAESALAAVNKGIESVADDADLRYVQAELLHATGKDVEAAAAIKVAAELEPKTAFYRRQVRRFEALAEAAG